MLRCGVLVCMFIGLQAGMAQPVISSGGVFHAGNYGRNVAPGSLFLIFGSGLGPAQLVQAAQYPLQTTLSGTSVRVSVSGQSWDAPVVYTSASQVAAILPSATPNGEASVTVTYSGATSSPGSVRVVQAAFGAFTANARGSGTAVLQNFVSEANQPRNNLDTAATPGQVVTLWGTGLGAAAADDVPSPQAASGDVQVFVGDKLARVLYSGRSGCCAGVDQIVFQVPADVAGCYVPIRVQTSGTAATTQNMTLSVAPRGGVCTEPGLLTSEDLDSARTQGSLKIGSLLLIRYAFGDLQTFDYGFVSFSQARYDDLARASRNLTAAAPGTCETARYDMNTGAQTGGTGQLGQDFFTNYLFWGVHSPLDAGDRIIVAGTGRSMTFGKVTNGFYSNFGYDPGNPGSLSSFLGAGNYTIEGSGGQHVPAFRTSVTVPDVSRFGGSMEVTVPRSQDYTLRWTGSSGSERVLVSGWSYSLSPLAVGTFTCVGTADARSFTVPASVLSSMPASDNMAQGFGYLAIYSFTPFQRSSVTGLDAFYAGVMNLSYQAAKFQ